MWRWYILSSVRSKGKPINAVVNIHDISKARENENFREAILSMLGHELQTPLAIIKGYTDTLPALKMASGMRRPCARGLKLSKRKAIG